MKILIGIVSLLCVFTAGNLMAEETLTASVIMIPPYGFQDAAGQLQGLEVDLVTALAKEAGFQVTFKDYPWNRAMNSLQDGTLDILLHVSKTAEREAFIHFLGISTYEQIAILVKEENKGLIFNTLDDLTKENSLFGIRQNFFYSEEFNRRLETDAAFKKHFEAVAKLAINIEKMKADRIIGCLGDRIGLEYLTRNDDAYKRLTVITTPFFQPNPVYFGVSKQMAKEKLDKLQNAYQKLESKGVFAEILKKW